MDTQKTMSITSSLLFCIIGDSFPVPWHIFVVIVLSGTKINDSLEITEFPFPSGPFELNFFTSPFFFGCFSASLSGTSTLGSISSSSSCSCVRSELSFRFIADSIFTRPYWNDPRLVIWVYENAQKKSNLKKELCPHIFAHLPVHLFNFKSVSSHKR